MIVSVIAATSEDGVIGLGGDLPWHLSADLRRFRRLTTGHHIIMGRKTYDSLGRPLPDRTSVVITRNVDYRPADVVTVHSLEEAFEASAGDDEVFVIGGGQIYAQAMSLADRLHLTTVFGQFTGDTHFPDWDLSEWRCVERTEHSADEKNPYDYRFEQFDRIESVRR